MRTRTGDNDNNKGGEGKVGTMTMPSTAQNVTRKDKKKSATTTAVKKNNSRKKPPPKLPFCVFGNTMIKTKKTGLHTDLLVTYD